MLADSVGLALLVVLDTLTPAERLAFVLHDMFAMPFTEVAGVLGRSTDATRQLASRARRRVRGAPSPDRAADLGPPAGGDHRVPRRIPRRRPVGPGRAAGLRCHADRRRRRRPVRQAGACCRARRWSPAGAVAASVRAAESQLALVDGDVGVVFAPAGHLQIVLALTVSAARRITAIDVIADPARLRRLRLAVLPD